MSTGTDQETTELDMEELGRFAEQVAGVLTGGATTAMMVIGDRLGLYRALAQGEALTPGELAEATDTAERYVREWLAQQAAVGFVQFEAQRGRFSMSPEHAAVLATDESPASLIGCGPMITGLHRGLDRAVTAFRTGAGIPWADQDPAVFESTERFFGAAYRTNLVGDWIPALDGVEEKLLAGARVVDVGCGHGSPLILLAQAFPQSTFIGYDVHTKSVEVARERAADAGVSNRVAFEVNHCHGYPQDGYDVVTFFDSFHDLGDPVGAAAHALDGLAPDGSLVLVEPMAGDDLATTLAEVPVAGLAFAASTVLCTANSLSQPVGLALGGQAGEAKLRDALVAGGFDHVRRTSQTPFHMVLQAKP